MGIFIMTIKEEIAFGGDFLVSDDSADNSNQTMNASDYLVAFSGQNKCLLKRLQIVIFQKLLQSTKI
jgi:hypothetical protein